MKSELYKELYEDMTKEYFRACREGGDLRIKLDKSEEECNKLINILKEIVVVPVAKSMYNEALILHNIAHKALEEISKND